MGTCQWFYWYTAIVYGVCSFKPHIPVKGVYHARKQQQRLYLRYLRAIYLCKRWIFLWWMQRLLWHCPSNCRLHQQIDKSRHANLRSHIGMPYNRINTIVYTVIWHYRQVKKIQCSYITAILQLHCNHITAIPHCGIPHCGTRCARHANPGDSCIDVPCHASINPNKGGYTMCSCAALHDENKCPTVTCPFCENSFCFECCSNPFSKYEKDDGKFYITCPTCGFDYEW